MSNVAPAPSIEEARARADRIRSRMRVLAEWRQDVIAAYVARDWAALGYETWEAYLDGEYGEDRVKLPRDQRREIVAGMAQAGMSTRAIGAAIGTHKDTVRNDLAASSSGDFSPVADRVLSLDGRERPAPRPAPNQLEPGLLAGDDWTQPDAEPEVVDAELVDEPTTRPTSPPPVPERVPDRQPRVDAARTVLVALTELRQTRESLQAITAAHLARQDEETRRIWAARLHAELEALHSFHNTLIKENNK